MISIQTEKGGRPSIPNRQGLYSKTAKYAGEAIEAIGKLLKSKNEAIRLGAARTILDKCLPDVKEINLETQVPADYHVTILAGNGFIPPNLPSNVELKRI